MALNNTTTSIALLGGGNMGRAMAEGWLSKGLTPTLLTIIDTNPSSELLKLKKQYDFHLLTDLSEFDGAFECLIVAVKPQIAEQALANIKPKLTSDSLVLSVAAGKTIQFFKDICEPAKIVRTIPNTPCLVGKGAIGAACEASVSNEQKQFCDLLLGAIGKTFWVDEESQIDAITALSGSGPAYIFHMCEAMAEAGESLGLSSDMAQALARQTIAGAGVMLEQAPESAQKLRENVTSPNGVTQAALEVIMGKKDISASNLTELMTHALKAAKVRNKELSN